MASFCDWCHKETGPEVYTLRMPGDIQILVGRCCAREASDSQASSPTKEVATRAREVLHILGGW